MKPSPLLNGAAASSSFKVDFMIVGAQKCGTTSLARILGLHPSLMCSRAKEPHFFSARIDWRARLPEYEALFPLRDGAMYFEASTSYTFYPHRRRGLWNDLYAYNPAMKFLYIVRHPVERIVSGYMHAFERGYTDLDLQTAIAQDPLYIDITRYHRQIIPFQQRFGRERVKILFFEDLCARPQATALEVAEFLGVDPEPFRQAPAIHANPSLGGGKLHRKFDRPGRFLTLIRRFCPPLWRTITDNSARAFHQRPQLPSPTSAQILRQLEPDIAALETLTGRDLTSWRTCA